MKHLLICGEYPPAPFGGIGTYAAEMSRLLADTGETVHVISKSWLGAESDIELQCDGKLIIHRIPYQDWASIMPRQPHPSLEKTIAKSLFNSRYPPQCFSWCAALLAERLVAEEDIDVIEAQEYEAPLYYFQLRRALGMGPHRKPPCIVHLHSPTELIARHSEWNSARNDLAIATQLEDYSIRAADQLACPSRYLASQIASKYSVLSDDICVIPYPIGSTPFIERDEKVWSSGTVLFLGRLELRKGVIEWVDAAVPVAKERPGVRFEFVGDDTVHRGTSVLGIIRRRIPREIARQFHFRGGLKHREMLPFLEGARICVVPSRWENFPNVCIEAMASGLPVLASDAGGMVEMICDGVSGWIGKPNSASLSDILRSSLATPPNKLARMGEAAASRIRELCNNKAICEAHLTLRQIVTKRGAWNSVHLPKHKSRLPNSQQSRDLQDRKGESGVAVIVVFSPNDEHLQQCLQSIRLQRRQPTQIVLVSLRPLAHATIESWHTLLPRSWRLLCAPGADPIAARDRGIYDAMESGSNPLGLVVITPKDELEPEFLELSESLLLSHPQLGVITGWVASSRRSYSVWMRPIFPLLRDSNEDAPCIVFRASALRQLRDRGNNLLNTDGWHIANMLVKAGWQSITIPRVWAHHQFGHALSQFMDMICCSLWSRSAGRNGSRLRPERIDAFAGTLLVWREQINLLRTLLRRPLHTGVTVATRLRNKFMRRIVCDSPQHDSRS